MKYKFLIPKQKEKEDKGQKKWCFARKISQFCAISFSNSNCFLKEPENLSFKQQRQLHIHECVWGCQQPLLTPSQTHNETPM
jgi:hypothetical protein